jgi:class 3 adenylate cyclase/predicted ATPase
MDIGGWLRGLGLEQYEAAFRENEIDGEVLPKLTAEDLKDLGVAIVGHRRRILSAIVELLGSVHAAAPIAPPDLAAEPAPTALAERRQLTVVFCDLVGSTALSARLDPEDMRGIIGAYQGCCASLVQHHGGFVAKYMGDGVLAYFGYPQAHEHDAERAVLAGLAIVEAAPKLVTATGSPLHVRVGIATGLVVVGDLVGSGEAQERSVIGETPNLAARLQAVAEPDSVVIAEGTRRLLGNLFMLQDLGALDLKGISGRARAWTALRSSSLESRFEALHATDLTALVGRDEEFDLLLRRWSRAKAGEGQVVLLSGEAGIGKSRLTAALLERLANEEHTRLRYFCSPQHTDSALHPIIGQMERAAGLAHDDPPKAKLDKLDTVLAPTSTSIEHATLFAEMLSLPNDGRYPALDLTAPQRRQRTFEALAFQVEALARQSPVLMIFEDAHWTDPTSMEAFGRTVDRIAGFRALLIVTSRPEFEAPWIGRPHVTPLTINRLERRDTDAMIDRVAGNKPIPASVRQDIVERADGIPLFVEEMTKAVLEAESESEARRTVAAAPHPALAVPATLHASLMARLDRLGSAKAVAQFGAAIGREFSHALLASVALRSDAELGSALDRLIRAGLLFRQGAPPHATYLFKHALVQDAAYGTLLREPRRALHARIAETLESQFAEIGENQPELLARHCTEAGLIEKAAHLWGKAGRRSMARSAFSEAAEQLTRALAQIAALPTTPALRQEEIKLQVALVAPVGHAKGFAAPETKAAGERARLLIEQAEAMGEPVDDPLLLFTILRLSWSANWVAFDGGAMCALAAQFLALAEKQSKAVPLVIGHSVMGISLMATGDVAESLDHFDRAIALYDPTENRALVAARFIQDGSVTTLLGRAWTRWLLGYPEAALRDAESALSVAREIGQAATLMYALGHYPKVQILCGNLAVARARAQEQATLAVDKGALFWKPFGMMNQGCALALIGAPSEAIELLNAGIAMARAVQSTMWLPFHLLHLARAHTNLRQFDDARRCIDDAIIVIEATKEKWCEAEVHRTAGDIDLMSSAPDAEKAQAHFERALAIARSQQTRSWELRAATSLARLWRDQGKLNEARDLLAPIYGWFTEGFDTHDLKEAKALLDALAP